MNPARTPPCYMPNNRRFLPCRSPQLPPQRLVCPGQVPPHYNPHGCCNFDSRPPVSYACNMPLNSPTTTMHRNLTSPQEIILMNRETDMGTNAISNTGNNDLLDDVQRSMSSAYERIRNQYVTSENELKELRKNRADLSAININLKKEITNLKRERSISSKLVEKLKKDNEVGIEKVAQQQIIVDEQREELREAKAQTKSQAEKIASLEEKCKKLEMKYNELFSTHVDQKVENLLGQTDRKNLTDKITTLNESVESLKLKIAELSVSSGNLLRENERLRNQLKIQGLELKAEKLLKEQILKEEIAVLTKPTFLNKMLRQKCEQEQLFNLVNMKRDEDVGNFPQQGEMLFAGNKMSVLVKRGYDQLIAEVESLKEKLYKDDPKPGTSQAYGSSVLKKIRISSNSHFAVTSPIVFSDEQSELDNASINGTSDSYDSADVVLVEVGEDPQDTQTFAAVDDDLMILPTTVTNQVVQTNTSITDENGPIDS